MSVARAKICDRDLAEPLWHHKVIMGIHMQYMTCLLTCVDTHLHKVLT